MEPYFVLVALFGKICCDPTIRGSKSSLGYCNDRFSTQGIGLPCNCCRFDIENCSILDCCHMSSFALGA